MADSENDPPPTLKDAGLAKVTLIYLDSRGGMRIRVDTVTQDTLSRLLGTLEAESVP